MVNTSTDPKPAPPKRIYFQPKQQVTQLAARARSASSSSYGQPSSGYYVEKINGRSVVRSAPVSNKEGDIIARIMQEQNINRLANEQQQIRFAAITNSPSGADLLVQRAGQPKGTPAKYTEAKFNEIIPVAIPTFKDRIGRSNFDLIETPLPPIKTGRVAYEDGQVKVLPYEKQQITGQGIGEVKQLTGRRKEDIPEIAERINRAKLLTAKSQIPQYAGSIEYALRGYEPKISGKQKTPSKIELESVDIGQDLYGPSIGQTSKKPKTVGVGTGINPYSREKKADTLIIGAPSIPLAGKEANFFEQLSRLSQRAGYNYAAGTLNIPADIIEIFGGKTPYKFKYINSPAQLYVTGEGEKLSGDKDYGEQLQAIATKEREQSPLESDIELGLSSFGIGFDVGSLVGGGVKGVKYVVEKAPRLIEGIGKSMAKEYPEQVNALFKMFEKPQKIEKPIKVDTRSAKQIAEEKVEEIKIQKARKLIDKIYTGTEYNTLTEKEKRILAKYYQTAAKTKTEIEFLQSKGIDAKQPVGKLRDVASDIIAKDIERGIGSEEEAILKAGGSEADLKKVGNYRSIDEEIARINEANRVKNLRAGSRASKEAAKKAEEEATNFLEGKSTKPYADYESGYVGAKQEEIIKNLGGDIRPFKTPKIKEPKIPTEDVPKGNRKKYTGYIVGGAIGGGILGIGLVGLGKEPYQESKTPTTEQELIEIHKIKEIPTELEEEELVAYVGDLSGGYKEENERKTSLVLTPILFEDLFQEPKLSQKQAQQLFFEESGKSPNPSSTKTSGVYGPDFNEVSLYDTIEIQRGKGLFPEIPLPYLQQESGGAFNPFDEKAFQKYFRVFDVAKTPFGAVKVGLGYYEDFGAPFEELQIKRRGKRLNPFFKL